MTDQHAESVAVPTPEEWMADAVHAVCFISGCDYMDIDVRGPVFLRDNPWPYHACTEHWEAIIGIVGRQHTGDDAHRPLLNDGRDHAFKPGVNSDGDPPNPAWCNVCGERHNDGKVGDS